MNATEELQYIDDFQKVEDVVARVDAIRKKWAIILELGLIFTVECTNLWLNYLLKS